ncbi:hypothetical protein ILUMI_16336 [Ignelater luminosus]|uniref:PDZ domain-containing protein n=1 Tax=Ignelater luminosus TaxID=2038154 RepID=A0A8K0CT57_IGNLU|nr:hypothetical protein ILUMI_16336 [Ignelater luminosus]
MGYYMSSSYLHEAISAFIACRGQGDGQTPKTLTIRGLFCTCFIATAAKCETLLSDTPLKMGGRLHEFVVTLKRNSPNIAWGFSLVGGADVNTPLIITKVAFGSPSDGVLQRGDIISKVGNYDARDIRHQDAQTLFKNAGDNVRIVVHR